MTRAGLRGATDDAPERGAENPPDDGATDGTRRRLIATVGVGMVILLGVVVPVAVMSAGDQPETVSPQELVDRMAQGGAGDDEPRTLADRPAPDDRAPLPAVELAGFDGGPARSTTDYRGAPLVVNFWASWCDPCVDEMPDLDALADRAGGQLNVLGVNRADAAAAAAELAERLDVSYDLAVDADDTLFAAVDGFGMPTTLFVDADGTIVHRRTGAMTAEEFRAALAEYLGLTLPE